MTSRREAPPEVVISILAGTVTLSIVLVLLLLPDNQMTTTSRLRTRHRILCWVLNSADAKHEAKARAIRATWGPRCDRLLFVRGHPQLANNKTKLTGDQLLVPMDHESRGGLFYKSVTAFSYLRDNELTNFDWFVKADDDTYLLVDALRRFLIDKRPKEPVYFGFRFKALVRPQGYMSGGPGYLLSQRALELLVDRAFRAPADNTCRLQHARPELADPRQGENEDLEVGNCLQSVGVIAGDTRDDTGRPRFLVFSPRTMLDDSEPLPAWYQDYTYYPAFPTGFGCCSRQPISFHYVEASEMRLIDWLLYHVEK